jgi:hypothetical protein
MFAFPLSRASRSLPNCVHTSYEGRKRGRETNTMMMRGEEERYIMFVLNTLLVVIYPMVYDIKHHMTLNIIFSVVVALLTLSLKYQTTY